MSSHRFLFYAPDATPSSKTVTLKNTEHHHLTRVLRCRVGDEICVTNGSGVILCGRVNRIEELATVVEVVSVVEDRRPGPPLVLALAAIKKEKFEQAVEQCVELGITHCIPFVARKSVLKGFSENYHDRLKKIALSAMKQSFRPFLPVIETPVTFDELLAHGRLVDRLIAGGQGEPPVQPPDKGESVMVVVGPESGLTDEERAGLAGAGAQFVSASLFRLRSETAAVVLISSLGQRN